MARAADIAAALTGAVAAMLVIAVAAAAWWGAEFTWGLARQALRR